MVQLTLSSQAREARKEEAKEKKRQEKIKEKLAQKEKERRGELDSYLQYTYNSLSQWCEDTEAARDPATILKALDIDLKRALVAGSAVCDHAMALCRTYSVQDAAAAIAVLGKMDGVGVTLEVLAAIHECIDTVKKVRKYKDEAVAQAASKLYGKWKVCTACLY